MRSNADVELQQKVSSDPDAKPLLSADNDDAAPATVLIMDAAADRAPAKKSCCSSFLERLKDSYNLKRNVKDLFVNPRPSGLTVLDGIRAIGILWVIGSHTWWAMSWNFWSGHPNRQQYYDLDVSIEMRVIRNGDLAVDMFFVLSGFLIAHLLITEFEKTGTMNVLRFYSRRFMRIAPSYYLVLALFWGIQYFVTFCENCNFCHYVGWSNILFINNLASPFFITCMIWTWSIAVEVQFYIISPLLVLLTVKRPRAGISVMLFLIAVCIALRGGLIYYYDLYHGVEPPVEYSDLVYNKVWTRMSPYLMGMIIAYANRRWWRTREDAPRPMRTKILWLVGFFASFVVCGYEVYFGHSYDGPPLPDMARLLFLTFHRTLYGAGACFLISAALVVKRGDGIVMHYLMVGYRWVMGTRFMHVFCQLSYPMYLVHVILISGHQLLRPLDYITYWKFLEYWLEHIVYSFVVAVPLHLLVERPWMNMRW